jgi:hypothetical protein
VSERLPVISGAQLIRLKRGTLNGILRDAGLGREELRKLL